MDIGIIPTNTFQARIHLEAKVYALDELLATIKNYDNVGQVMGEINNMKDEIKEMLDE